VVIDSSALVAILRNEHEAASLVTMISKQLVCLVSAASLLEVSIVLGTESVEWLPRLDAFIAEENIIVEPVTHEQAMVAREAYLRYGKGRHPASLNFGDCFSYALAKVTALPLLFKGNDFSLTDVSSVLY